MLVEPNFEQTTADIAISNGYDYVLCGHIHQPEIKTIKTDKGQVEYLNSGDWIENLTALEYVNNEWSIYKYNPKDFEDINNIETEDEELMMNDNELFKKMLSDFLITTQNNLL